MAFCSSYYDVISSVAIVQSSTEDVWAAGKSVAAVLVVAYDCTPYKCCMVSLSLETIADLLE
jgi:hypothetical protein